MSSFKLDFRFPVEYINAGKTKYLSKYPKLNEDKMKMLTYEIFGELTIIMDGLIQIPPSVKETQNINYSATEYLLDFFYMCLRELSKIDDGKKHSVDFLDNPLNLSFQKVNNNVKVSFSTNAGIIGKTLCSHQEFLIELINISNKLINILININPKLSESNLIKTIKSEIKKVEDLYQTRGPLSE